MLPVGIVKSEVSTLSLSGLSNKLIGLEIRLFILDTAPLAFNKNVAHPSAFAIHADSDVVRFQHTVNASLVNCAP